MNALAIYDCAAKIVPQILIAAGFIIYSLLSVEFLIGVVTATFLVALHKLYIHLVRR